MLLDPSSVVSCDSLAFTHSVWRSSKLVPVGYLPRLHKRYDKVGDASFVSFYSAFYVWLHGTYSLLLTHAMIMHRDELAVISTVYEIFVSIELADIIIWVFTLKK